LAFAASPSAFTNRAIANGSWDPRGLPVARTDLSVVRPRGLRHLFRVSPWLRWPARLRASPLSGWPPRLGLVQLFRPSAGAPARSLLCGVATAGDRAIGPAATLPSVSLRLAGSPSCGAACWPAGLLHPAAGHGVRRVSDLPVPDTPSPPLDGVVLSALGRRPRDAGPFGAFPSPVAAAVSPTLRCRIAVHLRPLYPLAVTARIQRLALPSIRLSPGFLTGPLLAFAGLRHRRMRPCPRPAA